ncbi:hypothetical protein F2P81_000073 [Scophthalmus maximus]|uniref:Ig-like domain-containing protein n=1 Tax=Scophthalmus maximus TaxID=52904 RepID=A0A6A4TS85_SCOMX|nr:hypothetical protein F2P81_000073 [Scophthalmus maximus]
MLLFPSLGHSVGQDITANRARVFSASGQTVTLSCNYSVKAENLQWYRQDPGSAPQYLLLITDTKEPRVVRATPPQPGLTAALNQERNRVDLKISSAAVTDSAVYYCVSCEQLSPVQTEEFSVEGRTVTLSYDFSRTITAGDYFFWYRQDPGKPPEFLLHISGLNVTRAADSLKSETRFFSRLSEENHGVKLQISSAAVSDSAVYYCALRPTVTGNTKPLYKNTTQYFPSATRGRHYETSDSNPYLYWYKQDGNNRPTFILSHFTVGEGVSCEQLSPVQTEEFSVEGRTVTLSYDFSRAAASNDYFFWYRQDPGKPPEFLVSHSGTGQILNSRVSGLSVTVSGDKTQMDLKISSAAVSDSAVYYCALRPTVTGNTKPLYKNTTQYFPSATRGRHYETSDPNPYLYWYKQDGNNRPTFILSHFTVGEDISCGELTPVKTEEFSVEGRTVTLSCNDTKLSSSDYFFWYRQHPGKPPEFLISHTGTGQQLSDPVSGLSVTVRDISCGELTPVKTEEFSVEGRTVTLSCNDTKLSSSDYFFWYRQHPGKPPEFLISHSASGEVTAPTSGLMIKVEQNQINMIISSAAVSDSAVYYCALRPTVTGNNTTLYKNLCSKQVNTPHDISCGELTPVKTEEFSVEGRTVTLSCNDTKLSSSDYFFWYRQHPGKPPEFLISHTGTGQQLSDPVSGLSVTVRGVSCEQLSPVQTEEFSVEGRTVTLSYDFSRAAASNDYFFWYRQDPGKPPEFLVSHSGTGQILNSRVSGLSVTMEHCLWIIAAALVFDISCGELTPVKTEEFSVEGRTVTLSCNDTKLSSSDYFFWYRQHPGKPPEFLISHSASGEVTAPTSGLMIKVEQNQINMIISSAAVTDSAVYYCAVKPTVTGNNTTLYKNLCSKQVNTPHGPLEGVTPCHTSVFLFIQILLGEDSHQRE